MEFELPTSLSQLLTHPRMTDLVINGFEHCYLDTGSGLTRIQSPFLCDAELTELLMDLGYQTGNRIDMAKPISDFMVFGFRFHAVLPHGVSTKPLLSVRKHHRNRVTLEHLLEVEMISEPQLMFLRRMLQERKNIVVAGATSSGKTTLLSALIAELTERTICIEQIPELVIREPAISLQERVANQEGFGAITMQQLVIESLRMRPDRIVVGEVRGSEFGVLLQAMNNGHTGTMATIHAKSLSSLPDRLVMLGLLSGFDKAVTKQMVSSSFDVVLQLQQVAGKRRLAQIGEFGRDLQISEVTL